MPKIAKPESAKLMFCSNQSSVTRAKGYYSVPRKRSIVLNQISTYQKKLASWLFQAEFRKPGSGDVLSLRSDSGREVVFVGQEAAAH